MVLRRVVGRRGHSSALAGLVGLAVSFVLAISPAEARRHHLYHGPVYQPPFAAMVVDAKTGRTLYAENEDALRHPASVTKVMTLYLLFEHLEKGRLRLDTPLRISAHAAAQAPSKLGLPPGSAIEVEDAIKAIVTKSANDVAAAIAENIAGSEEAFADMMTRKARALGMGRTIYVNASGLPDPEQVTTARDLTILARAIQERFPRYYGYFSMPVFRFAGYSIRNHNHLLGRVEGVDGIKTGYTRASGFNLMTSARSEGHHIVAVVLGGRSGASRDRIMAALVEQHLPRAYAGARIAPVIAEAQKPRLLARAEAAGDDDDDEIAPAPVRPGVPPTLAKPALVVAAPAREAPARAETIRVEAGGRKSANELANVRPVVASATGSLSTTTPSAFRWVTGAPPAARGEGRPIEQGSGDTVVKPTAYAAEAKAPEVRVLDPKAFESRVGKEAVAKPDARHDAKIDARPTGSAGWVIQLGATEDEAKAKEILAQARDSSRMLIKAAPFTERIVKDGTTLWRARFSGFDPDSAQAACKALKRSGFSCFATKG